MPYNYNFQNIIRNHPEIEPLVQEIRKSENPEMVVSLGRKLCSLDDGLLKKVTLSCLGCIIPGVKEKMKRRYIKIAYDYLNFRENMPKWEGEGFKVHMVGNRVIAPADPNTIGKNIEKQEGIEERTNQLLTIMGLRLVPYSDSEKERRTLDAILKEKQEFLIDENNGINLSTASSLFSQCKRFPIMGVALAALRESYEQWDQKALRGEEIHDLQYNIRAQQQNVQALSEILSSITNQYDEAGRALSRFLPQGEEDIRLKNLLNKCQSGQERMTLAEEAALERHLTAKVKEILSEEEQTSLEDLEEARRKTGVTTKSIRQQSELQEAIRGAKRSAATQEHLNPLGDSHGDVYRIQNADDQGPIAFYKVGKGGEEAAGAMEKLMWDLSVIMGLEEQFVATGRTTIHSRSNLQGGIENVKRWDNGELVTESTAQVVHQGGIQRAQKGMTLKKWHDAEDKIPIPKEEIIKAMATSIAFGMYDAHIGNIFINETGKIKFFDNTRSLPHSNETINWAGNLLSSYRSCLLTLKESHRELLPEDLEQLRSLVRGYEEKLPQLKQYLRSPIGKSQIRQLPPGWLNPAKAYKAMEERIHLMNVALESGKVHSLRDFAILSNPGYQFSLILVLAADYSDYIGSQFEQGTLDLANCLEYSSGDYCDYLECIVKCTKMGIDMAMIKQWCDDPNFPFERILHELGEHFVALQRGAILGPEVLEIIRQKNRAVFQELYAQSELELKDINRTQATDQMISHRLTAAGCDVRWDCPETIYALQYEKQAILITVSYDTSPYTYYLTWKLPTGEVKKAMLDVHSQFGFVQCPDLDLPRTSLEEFSHVMNHLLESNEGES